VNLTQEVKSILLHYGPEITEVVQTNFITFEVSGIELNKREVKEPKFDIFQPESPSTIIAPTLAPPSARRKLIITIGLPPGVISIEYITQTEEEESPHTLVTTDETSNPRVFPSVPFNAF